MKSNSAVMWNCFFMLTFIRYCDNMYIRIRINIFCVLYVNVSRRLRAFTWAMKRIARLLGVSVESMVGLVWYHKTAR